MTAPVLVSASELPSSAVVVCACWLVSEWSLGLCRGARCCCCCCCWPSLSPPLLPEGHRQASVHSSLIFLLLFLLVLSHSSSLHSLPPIPRPRLPRQTHLLLFKARNRCLLHPFCNQHPSPQPPSAHLPPPSPTVSFATGTAFSSFNPIAEVVLQLGIPLLVDLPVSSFSPSPVRPPTATSINPLPK